MIADRAGLFTSAAIVIGFAGFTIDAVHDARVPDSVANDIAAVDVREPRELTQVVDSDKNVNSDVGICDALCPPRFPIHEETDCFDRDDRDACLQVVLEDQAIAYMSGVEAYQRGIPFRRGRAAIDALPKWKTIWPPETPFECHIRL